jgi:hypothetical protein
MRGTRQLRDRERMGQGSGTNPERGERGISVLSGEKILITGPRGDRVQALPDRSYRTTRCGASRGSVIRQPAEKVGTLGVTTRALDISSGDFGTCRTTSPISCTSPST